MTKTNDDAARKARLQGSELSKLNLKGKSLQEMEAEIRAAKARANAAYAAGKDVPKKPVAAPLQGTAKLKREQMLRRAEEKAKQESRRQVRKDSAEPKAKSMPSSKGPRGTSGVKTSNTAPPSTERFGPGGMMGTVDQPHERRFQWRR
jgi:hypothetical protein